MQMNRNLNIRFTALWNGVESLRFKDQLRYKHKENPSFKKGFQKVIHWIKGLIILKAVDEVESVYPNPHLSFYPNRPNQF